MASEPPGGIPFAPTSDRANGELNPAPVLLSRADVLSRLGISRETLRSRVKEGLIRSIKRGREVFYHPDEISAEEQRNLERYRAHQKPHGMHRASVTIPTVPPPKKTVGANGQPKVATTIHLSNSPDYSGAIAAKACRLFEEGKTPREVVMDLEITFELVEHLYAKWKQLGQEWHLPAKQLLYVRERLSWNENPPTAQGFVAALERTVTSVAEEMTREVTRELSKPADKPPVGEPLSEAERQALADLEKEDTDE